jgi:hypothetical protein
MASTQLIGSLMVGGSAGRVLRLQKYGGCARCPACDTEQAAVGMIGWIAVHVAAVDQR